MCYPFQNTALELHQRVQDLCSRLTIEEKIGLLSSHQQAIPRLGIGEWYVGQEVARGYVSREKNEFSTVFPQPIGLASTFDPPLMEQIGEIAGTEARAFHRRDPKGHLMVWGPTVDPERDPRWGRTEEAYGEDPFLIGEMSAAYTRGLAGDDPVYLRTLPALKHFCANNNEEKRNTSNSDVTPRTLHEYYYRAFERAVVDGGAHSLMTAYNELAGVPGCMNPDLNRVVKEQWGLLFAVTDGGDFSQNVLSHRSHKTHAEALAACLKSGCDIMVDDAQMVAAAARDALARGLLTEAEITRSVAAVLMGRFRLGEFDGEQCPYNTEETPVDTLLHRTVCRTAAMEQMCLLKNEGILPLKAGQKIALIGPLADENYRDWYTGTASYHVSVFEGLAQTPGCGVRLEEGYDIVAVMASNGKYWSVEDDGRITASAEAVGERERFYAYDWDFGSLNLRSCYNQRYVTEQKDIYYAVSETPYEWFIREWLRPEPYDGQRIRFRSWHDTPMYLTLQEDGSICAAAGSKTTAERLFTLETIESGVRRAAALAQEADVAVICVGNHPMQVARECYDRPTLDLPAHQRHLIRVVRAANPRAVLLICSSYPYALHEAADVPAILYTSHAGPELGTAAAATLFGENNPAARTPITWYANDSDLPPILEYDIIRAERTYLYDRTEPLFPFGHGLSYSTFSYRDFRYELHKDGVMFTLFVRNTSELDGEEVVQIYYHLQNPSVKRPIRQLCGFQRLFVEAGGEEKVQIFVPWYALEYYDVVREEMVVEEGIYTFCAGASSADLRLELTADLPGKAPAAHPLSVPILCKNADEWDGMATAHTYAWLYQDWAMRTNEWGGSLYFDRVEFGSAELAELTACAPCGQAEVTLLADDEVLGSVSLPPARGTEDYAVYRIKLTPAEGIHRLEIRIGGYANIYRLHLCSSAGQGSAEV